MADIALTGASALLAFQRALDTAVHNIANVATDGYSRQRVDLASRPGQQLGDGFFGNGVQVTGVTRLSDRFVFDRILESLAAQSRLDRFAAYADRLDGLLSSADTGLAQPMQGYFDALQALSANPTSAAARNGVIAAAQTLVSRFSSLQSQLDSTQADINARLTQAAGDATDYAAQIAGLNEAIARATAAGGGQAPNDLLDQREQLLAQLAQKIGITTTAQDDGSVNVFTANGQALVVGFTSRTLSTLPDPYQPQRLELAIDNGSGAVRISSQASGGEIGGLLDFRREVLDPASGQLGKVAASLALAVNAQNAQGMDAYGNLGGDLFNAPSPSVQPSSLNAGSGTLGVTFADVAQLTGGDYRMGFDGANWSVTDAATGAAVAFAGAGTPANPFTFGGVSVVVGGAAAAGDTFLVRPTAGAAGALSLATADGNRIAAASPLRVETSLANTGSGTIGAPQVLDPADPSFLSTVTIAFTSATTYTINGGPAQAYTSGGAIAVNGWQVAISGAPAAGDSFTVRANAAGSSDNANARLLGGLSTAKLLDGGTTSLGGGYAGLVARAGGAAQQADLQKAAQDAVHSQLAAEQGAVSGVNLDEEAANLVRFQQAYQAAAQVIATATTVFESLLAAVRR